MQNNLLQKIKLFRGNLFPVINYPTIRSTL